MDHVKHGIALLCTCALLAVVAIGTTLLWYSWVKFLFYDHWRFTLICIGVLVLYYLVSLWVYGNDDEERP